MKNKAEEFINSKGNKLNGLPPDKLTVIKWLTEFAEDVLEAITVTRCSTQLPDKLQPVLAKIEHINSLGKSSWYEVVYNDVNWQSYQGSKTFEDGEKVVKWKYCKAIV